MTFSTVEDLQKIEQEMAWSARELPTTLYEFLTHTKDRFPNRPAISYQLLSGAKDKAETLTWAELHSKSVQAANLFRDLGVGEKDTIAYILPNANETMFTLLGGMIAGIVNPINPLLEPEQIGAILRETDAKVVVTLKPFPKTDVAQKVAEAVRHAPHVHTSSRLISTAI
jgi:fatty-acyl-CoA synthase/long-chain acyl-CoA synthetase